MIHLIRFSLVLGFIWLITGGGCSSPRAALGPAGPTIRVQLLGQIEQVTLNATESPSIRTTQTSLTLPPLPPNTPVAVVLAPDGWRVGNLPAGTGELIIQPASIGSVTVDKKAYRGQYRFVPGTGGRFDLINDVDMESYLKGVIAAEMFPNWEIEAFRAQAITARTYALYELNFSPRGGAFDVFNDTRSQVYGGISRETEKSRQCVDDTRGVVLAYGQPGQERIFKAYFSACCGGVSSNVTDVFNEPYIPPLGDRNMGTTCAAAKNYNWGPLVVPKDEITRRVRVWGNRKGHPIKDCARIEQIDPAFVNAFGRPVRFMVTDAAGTRFSLAAEELRNACNADAQGKSTLLSGFVNVAADTDNFTIAGRGHGHGVGLCQYCAQFQALEGMRHERILSIGYPGSKRVRAY